MDVEITRIPRPRLLLGQVGCQAKFYTGNQPLRRAALHGTTQTWPSCPGYGNSGFRLQGFVMSPFCSMAGEQPTPHIAFYNLPQHPQTPVWLTERRKETLCGVVSLFLPSGCGNQELLCQVPITMVFNVTKEGKMDPRSLAPRCA